MPLAVGTVAPDFTLKTKTAEGFADVTLSSHRGRQNVVLLFFPGVFTPPCTDELCNVSESLGDYSSLDAQVYGVSVDSAFAQEAWAKANNITVPLLSDFRRDVVTAYDTLLEDFLRMGPSSRRVVYLIDKSGTIRYVEETAALGEQPNFAALQEALRSL